MAFPSNLFIYLSYYHACVQKNSIERAGYHKRGPKGPSLRQRTTTALSIG